MRIYPYCILSPHGGNAPLPDWLDAHIFCFLALAFFVRFSSSSFDFVPLFFLHPREINVKGGSGLSTEDSPGAATGGDDDDDDDDDDGSMLSGGGDDGSMITWSLLMLLLIPVDAPSKCTRTRQFLTCRSILDALHAR